MSPTFSPRASRKASQAVAEPALRLRRLALSVLTAGLLAWIAPSPASGETSTPARTWTPVEDMSDAALASVHLETDTPRDARLGYLPAEPYPFTPPYTAEEMGYRAMEFTPRPRWSSVVANSWASIAAQGVLLNPGSSITFVNYDGHPPGVAKVLAAAPGGEVYRSLSQSVAPPAAEGGQWLAIRYRTDKEFVTKEERFRYSPSLRRVRHQVPFRRQSNFPNMALTPDDAWGRDAWEFSWRLLGTDVLFETVRFPNTRPTMIVRNGATGQSRPVPTAGLKPMGDGFPHYTADGGVACYVVEAVAREDWLPDYYAPRILYWLERTSFFPLRSEQYGPDGGLDHIETRMAQLFNPALGERGYGSFLINHWDLRTDIMSYLVNDSHKILDWAPEEAVVFFSPDFMRRQWYLDTSIKSQAQVTYPEEFFLRPALHADKFPDARPIALPPALAARIRAQNAAGRLVFAGTMPGSEAGPGVDGLDRTH